MKKILIFLVLLFMYKSTAATDLILYKGVISNDSISYEFLLSIFTKKQKFWKTGEKITVFIKPVNSVEHSIFAHEWLGVSVYRYKKILKKQIYSGQTSSVREVLSDTEMVRSILTTPYSIGYLSDGTLLYSLNSDSDITEIRVIYYE